MKCVLKTEGNLLGNIFPLHKDDKLFSGKSYCQYGSQGLPLEKMDTELMRKTPLENTCVMWASFLAWVWVACSSNGLSLGLPSWEWVPQSTPVSFSVKNFTKLSFYFTEEWIFSYNLLNVKHFCKAEKPFSPNQGKQQDKFSLESSVRGFQFSSVEASS